MTPESILAKLGDESALDNVRLHWDDSMAAMPADGPEFLRDDFWREYSRWCGFGNELDDALAQVAAAVRHDPHLKALAWHCYWRTYLSPEACPPSNWPEPGGMLGKHSGLFYLLPAIAFVPLMRRKHAEWGIPEHITRHTAQQVKRYCDDTYRRANQNHPGIFLGQLGWLRHYTRERYVRLGRLEYWLGPCPYAIEVYRHKTDGRVATLAPDGTRFAEDGTIYRDPADYAPEEGWTAALSHEGDVVSGHLLDPHGHGTRTQVKLSLHEWECVLKKGAPSLMMHIPSGGQMTPEVCRESLLEAAEFFPKTFPEEPPAAVVCSSWIFSPQLQQIFPPEANLCTFQRNLFLFPVASGPWDGLWFVFLQRGELDLDKVPRDTSVQRGIADYLAQGHRWRVAGMFILMDDIPRFGKEPYLRQWPPQV